MGQYKHLTKLKEIIVSTVGIFTISLFINYLQLHESLAKLVTENLHVKRWLFKIDNEFDGRGTG